MCRQHYDDHYYYTKHYPGFCAGKPNLLRRNISSVTGNVYQRYQRCLEPGIEQYNYYNLYFHPCTGTMCLTDQHDDYGKSYRNSCFCTRWPVLCRYTNQSLSDHIY